MLMKILFLLFLSAATFSSYSQVIKEGIREDGCYEYWATLDDYNTPIQFPIRVEQIDAQSVRFVGQTALKGKKATLLVRNLTTQRVDSIQIPDNGNFEMIIAKNVELTFRLSGFVTYSNDKLKIDNLSMLVLKMHPLPEEDIYLLIFKNAISSKDLDSFLTCLAKTKNSGSNNNCKHPEFIRFEKR